MNTFLDLWYTSETKSIIVNFNDEEHDFTSVADCRGQLHLHDS